MSQGATCILHTSSMVAGNSYLFHPSQTADFIIYRLQCITLPCHCIARICDKHLAVVALELLKLAAIQDAIHTPPLRF
jgi:hypothetical protein